MDKYIKNYVKPVKMILYKKHKITVSENAINQVLKYFLKNILISLYNQIPVTINGFFNIRIYSKINPKKDSK